MARRRKVDLKENRWPPGDSIRMWMTVGDTVIFFAAFIVLVLYEPKTEWKDAILLLLGVLLRSVTDARQYYFGTSQESVERQTIQNEEDPPPPQSEVDLR